jgi:uncharacterized protein (TIGR03435 family)
MKCTAFIFWITGIALGQAAEFEVASIKPATFRSQEYFEGYSARGTCGLPAVTTSGNRVTLLRATLCGLMRFAYQVQDYRIGGIPAWMTTRDQTLYYDVEAKAEGEAALLPERTRELLRALLASRFQLKFHREIRELPIYTMVVTKDGPKLSKDSGYCKTLGPRPKARFQGFASCEPITTMQQLADMLTDETDRPVLDRTGLSGTFAYSLRWTPDGVTAQADSPPSFFTAIQEQLGLKLEPDRGPVEILVIEQAERPSAN